jgi:hypothetical protein
MGTKFRTMLAPIGLSTGDGRRFQSGGITLDELPMPFEWARAREGGHDGAIQVGVVQAAQIGTVKEAVANDWIAADSVKGMDSSMEAVWASGEMYDDADRETMPRLAEDVAESMMLMGAGTLGPSVDLDSFEAVPVIEGTDEPITWSDIEDYYEEHGEEPKLELLITQGRVRAATLVSIPAFAETARPLELIEPEAATEGEAAAETADVAALIASTATATRPPVAAFALPELTGPTPITFDWDKGVVFGHIATWQTCHVGYSDVCVTAPRVGAVEAGSDGYAWFNRFPIETEDGETVWAGRLTVGGRHAGLELAASAAMAVYDGKTTAAHVRAYEDEFGIVVAGAIELAADSPERAVLDRRKVSGDWRETPAGLSLVEILALSPGPRAHAEPGFPVPGTFSHNGRQTALTAALGPVVQPSRSAVMTPIDIADAVRAALIEDRAASAARAALSRMVSADADMQRAALAAALQGS